MKKMRFVVYLVMVVFLAAMVNGCGGGGDNPPTVITTSKGIITVYARLTEPAGISDFSGILITVTPRNNGTMPAPAITKSDGSAVFSSLEISGSSTTYDIKAEKTDYSTANISKVLIKDGDQQTADLALQHSAGWLSSQAWTSFSAALTSGDFSAALASFQSAVSRAAQGGTAQEKADSNTGLGWTYLLGFASSDNPTAYQSALDAFTAALSANPTQTDALVGKTFTLMDINSSSGSLSDMNTAKSLGEQALSVSPTYTFSYATQFDYVDIHATLAFAYSQIYNSSGGVADDQTKACTHAKAVPSGYSNCATVCAAIATSGSCTSVPCCP